MQTKKKEVKTSIVKAAKHEFLELGFEKTSLRGIAARAGVTKGNLYIYFRNKNDLFCSIVKPAMDLMQAYMSQGADDDYIRNYTAGISVSERASVESFQKFSGSLVKYKDELRLLFFSSQGSGYADFREKVYEMYTASSNNFFDKWKKLHPERKLNVSEMLIHSFASMYLTFIEEILVHEPDDEELETYITQMAKFVHAGTVNVMKEESYGRADSIE